MKILLTGATGFIGRQVLTRLAARHDVVALARERPPADLHGDASWVEQDLTQPLGEVPLPKHVDSVVHLAQSRSNREFPERAHDVFEVNTHATLRLLDYARRAEASQFLLASTGGVYGYGPLPFRETDPPNPAGFYAASKRAAEVLTSGYVSYFRVAILRFFFVYGPGQRDMLVPSLLSKILAGSPVTIEGDPGPRLSPTFINDATDACEAALAVDAAGAFNVAGDDAPTVRELVTLMGDLAGRDPSIKFAPAGSRGDLVGDNTRMKHVLGIRPRVPLPEGLGACLQSISGVG
jgi:nucleoside-diphosphate-sugar epimerase